MCAWVSGQEKEDGWRTWERSGEEVEDVGSEWALHGERRRGIFPKLNIMCEVFPHSQCGKAVWALGYGGGGQKGFSFI